MQFNFRTILFLGICGATVLSLLSKPADALEAATALPSQSPSPAASPATLDIPQTQLTPEAWAIEKLNASQLPGKVLFKADASPEKVEQAIALNVLGFLYQADYSRQDTADALKKCRAFLKAHQKVFRYAAKKYSIAPESIAALLWVETKFGKRTGTHSLINVYSALLMADHPFYIQKTLDELIKKKPDADYTLKKKAVDRSKSKAAWALDQFKAIGLMIQHKNAKTRRWILNIKASYAGAFGYPQFIPSSYVQYAVTGRGKVAVDLYRADDAIMSVGHFLSQKGWDEDSEDSKVKALYEYNHSKDYGAIILQISGELRQKKAIHANP